MVSHVKTLELIFQRVDFGAKGDKFGVWLGADVK
jgi:hypothetical protein